MVAAGGGGSDSYFNGSEGGAGGNLIGGNGSYHRWAGSASFTIATGAKQTVGGTGAIGIHSGGPGIFGKGGSVTNLGGGGGSGYYGGGAGAANDSIVGSGAGGSSYISGYAGVNSINSESDRTHTNQTKHYSDKYFINTEMKAGVNSGNGKAKITYLKVPSSKDSTKIKGVRYIKDCINGSSANTSNHWTELQAISKGTNVAKGKTVTGTAVEHTSHPYSIIVDGKMDNGSEYGASSGISMQCITVDLEKEYDLEEIAVWHYYPDGRTYYNNSTQVAGENGIFRVLYSGNTIQTSNGNRIKKILHYR